MKKILLIIGMVLLVSVSACAAWDENGVVGTNTVAANATAAQANNQAIQLMANSTKIRAYVGATQSNLTDNTATQVQFNTETFDTLTEFDSTTNYRFTATRAGYYFIYVQILFTDVVADGLYEINLKKDGTGISQVQVAASDPTTPVAYDHLTGQLTDIVYFEISEYVDVWVRARSGGNTTDIPGGTYWSYITIYRLPYFE